MSDIIEELIHEMEGSYKRSEHSMFVSLKYSRTTEVIANLLDRYIETISQAVTVLTQNVFEDDKIYEIPETLIEKVNLLRDLLNDETINEMFDFMLRLKKIRRLKYTSKEEYRKNVSLIVKLDGEELVIKIPILEEYLQRSKSYVKYVKKYVAQD